jgi:predicted alpha/beta-fold hydrolase
MNDSERTDSGVFDPPWLLRNAHVQSVLSSSFLRRAAFRRSDATLESAADECILDCGNGVRLQGFHSAQRVRSEPRALVVLLHGWEGSAQSNYILHTGARLLAEGCDVFRLNFRDHGGTQALNRELFHSCRIAEVVGAVVEIARRFPARPLVVGGFSLGGNFALRVALRAPAAGIPLAWTFAVCPVISPRAGLRAIEDAPWFYEFYFMRKWRESLRRKQALFPDANCSRANIARRPARPHAQPGRAAHGFRHAGKLPGRLFHSRRHTRCAHRAGEHTHRRRRSGDSGRGFP